MSKVAQPVRGVSCQLGSGAHGSARAEGPGAFEPHRKDVLGPAPGYVPSGLLEDDAGPLGRC